MAKVIGSISSDICINSMKDGEVAEITNWPFGGYTGKVIQRYGDEVVVIGNDRNGCFTTIFMNTPKQNEDCRVRILPKGTRIEL